MPLFGILPGNQRVWGLVGVPTKVSMKTSSDWVALTGEEEPGGREALRTIVEGEDSLQEGNTPEG